MAENLTRKIIRKHLAEESSMNPGDSISVRFEHTYTHDINAVMCYLAFEGVGIPRVRTELSVSYLDHNLLYIDSKTPDDHIYLQSVAKHYGLWLSRPGNGIMHALQCARFAVPGKAVLGTDSHTPSCGAMAMLAIGGGGMDCAAVMAGMPLRLIMPQVINVRLSGSLRPGTASKDIVLEMLKRLSVKGGLGKIFEFTGDGLKNLEVPARMTIANMTAELGATSSIFPADEAVYKFLKAQEREKDYVKIEADEGCSYDGTIDINLDELEPLVACPDMPDNVVKVKDLEKTKVQQVLFGSCTNGSYQDIAKAALVLKGRHVNEDVSCSCAIASKQIYKQLLHDGYIDMLLDAGVRLTELACGACCGIGQSPATNGVSVRTFNRNFKGRSGNPSAKLYLTSPETAAATAVLGYIGSAEELMKEDVKVLSKIHEPESYFIDDSMFIKPLPENESAEIRIQRGPNIQPLPLPEKPEKDLSCKVSLKTKDNITTDDITPASAELSSMRSNIPLMSKYCFKNYDPEFSERARSMGSSIIVGGENYGQGSSREHAAINPMYLGVRAVIAKSMARIHKNNLVNHGVIPLLFENKDDYNTLDIGDELYIADIINQLKSKTIKVENKSKGNMFNCILDLSDDALDIILSGGQLRYIRTHIEY